MVAALLLFLIPWAQRTARTTNSMQEIRNYIPNFPEPTSSDEEEPCGVLDEDGFHFSDRKDVPVRLVHFADMAGSRWRSTGQLGVKKNRSMEFEGGGAERHRLEVRF
jgi:hypothetical protein